MSSQKTDKQVIQERPIICVWHDPVYGIAYFGMLVHILLKKQGYKALLKKDHIDKQDQEKLFEDIINSSHQDFNYRIYYCYTKEDAFSKLTTTSTIERLKSSLEIDSHGRSDREDYFFQRLIQGIQKGRIKKGEALSFLEEEGYFKEIDPKKSTLWRHIQHFTVYEQVRWWKKGPFAGYRVNFESVDISDLRDYHEVYNALIKTVIRINKKNSRLYIYIRGGNRVLEHVWLILGEQGVLPGNTVLFTAYDDKTKTKKRFKPIVIRKIPLRLRATLRPEKGNAYTHAPRSYKRKMAMALMDLYWESGFSIMILGERGIGKNFLVKSLVNNSDSVKYLNCSTLQDDRIAESTLFGYKKGCFTGAVEDSPGLFGAFENIENGVLFLDEVHHLSTNIQARLLDAMQTDKDNNYIYHRMCEPDRERKAKFKLVLASNLDVQSLQKALLPDFYDRIMQQMIELPPLRECKEDLKEDFKSVFIQTGANLYIQDPWEEIKGFAEWIEHLDLPGNFRDLQKIAIAVINYHRMTEEQRDIILKTIKKEQPWTNDLLAYLKWEYNRMVMQIPIKNTICIKAISNMSGEELEDEFKYKIVEWALQRANNNITHAAKLLKLSRSTINRWIKKGRSHSK